MVTYKKGDLWKALLLITMIAAAFWFSFRTLRNASGTRPAVPPVGAPQVPRSVGSQPTRPDVSSEMFAPRERPTTQLLMRAHAAPDPFRPYASTLPEATGAAVRSAAPKETPSAPPTPSAETMTQLRLVGVISGAHPTAVLVGADGHHYVRQGDDVAGGWRVAQVEQRSVLLTKGGSRARLALRRQEAPAQK